jgi:drug/metabolite transporter (DMT)-like permease
MDSEASKRFVARAGLVALALVWGTQFLIIKLGQSTLPPLTTAALRFAVLTAAAQIAVLLTGASSPIATRLQRTSFGVTLAIAFGLLYWAQEKIPSALAGVLSATTPLFVALLAHRFVVGERLTLARTNSLVLGFVGVSIIVLGTEPVAGAVGILAVLAILAGELASATNKVLAKQLTVAIPAPVLLRDTGMIVTILIGIAAFLFERNMTMEFTPQAVLAFVYLGLIASFAASGLYLILLRRYAVSALSYLQFATAAIATVTGTFIGGERISAPLAVGIIVVLAGLVLLSNTTAV